MVGLAALAQLALLDLDEVADVHLIRQLRTRPQPREGADAAVAAGLGLVQHAVRLHPGAGAELDVAQHAVRADMHAVAQFDDALEHTADVDEHVAPEIEAAAQVEARRVGEVQAVAHQALGLEPLEAAFGPGQLHAVVDALGLVGVGGGDALHIHTVLDRQLHHVGEVVFALGVVVLHLGQPALEAARLRGDEPGVDLGDRALRCAGVLLLDDAGDAAGLTIFGGIAQDAAVAEGIGQHGAEHGHAVLGRRHQLAQGFGGDQGHVAVEDQHQGAVRHFRHGLLHSMGGAQLLLLHHGTDLALPARLQPFAHRRGAMAEHDLAGLDAGLAHGVEHVAEHGLAADRVQHLGQRGLHARALAGGEDDGVDFHAGFLPQAKSQ